MTLPFWIFVFGDSIIPEKKGVSLFFIQKTLKPSINSIFQNIKGVIQFTLRSEQGGLHYGIVLDNNNHKDSKVITIVPLRSLKENENPEDIDKRFELYLGKALLVDKIAYVEGEIKKN